MVYHMQFLEYLYLLQKRGLSYGIYGISFPSPKMWTNISSFRNSFPFSIDVEYQMKFLELLFLLQRRGLSYAINGISFPSLETCLSSIPFLEFLFLLQKHGLSYEISGISSPSPKMWTIIRNF